MLVVNSPAGYFKEHLNVDKKPRAKILYHFVLLFAKNQSDIRKHAPMTVKLLKEESLFWIAYPKKNSSIKTNLTRDYGWQVLNTLGFKTVSLISIDDTWSALRFRPAKKASVEKTRRSTGDRKIFSAVIEKPDDGMDTAYISIPFDVKEVYKTNGQVKVNAWFDGYPYRGVLANMGTGSHIIIIRKDIRQTIGKNAGDKVKVELEKDNKARTVVIPPDLKKALSVEPHAIKFFNSLSTTNKKEYALWISSARRSETRKRRLTVTLKKLLQQKKNPFQK